MGEDAVVGEVESGSFSMEFVGHSAHERSGNGSIPD